MVNKEPPIDPNEISSDEGVKEPVFNAPISMVLLSALLVVCYLVYSLQGEETKFAILVDYALFPDRYFAEAGSFKAYANWYDGPLTFLTHGLLHADWAHVGMNAVFALAFGTGVVRALGVWRTLIIYVASQIGGALFYLYFGQIMGGDTSIAVGASGAVSGLTGAVFLLMAKGQMLSRQFGVLSCVFLLGNVMLAVVGPTLLGSVIAWEAHVGGYIVGGLSAAIMLRYVAES